MTIGLVGRKVGMTRIFSEDGVSTPVTVLEVEANRIAQVKTVDNDGYSALQVTTGSKKANRTNKPTAGHFAKAGIEAGRGLWEFRLNENEGEGLETGSEITVEIFKGLGIPIRVLKICSGDLGSLKYEQVDIEAYSPRRKDYFEVGSCSNLTDAQARRLGIRVQKGSEHYFAHTLNNTVVASPRALIAVLENFQNEDGSITVPKILVAYMGGLKRIVKK